jgi:hypothetical protein
VVEIRVTRRDSVNIDDLTELEKLNELRERGVLTQDEYDARKQRLLG